LRDSLLGDVREERVSSESLSSLQRERRLEERLSLGRLERRETLKREET